MTAAHRVCPRLTWLLGLAPILCTALGNADAASAVCQFPHCPATEVDAGAPTRLAASLGAGRSGSDGIGFSRSSGRVSAGRSGFGRTGSASRRRPTGTMHGTTAVPRPVTPVEPEPAAEGLVKNIPAPRDRRPADVYACRGGDCFTRRPWAARRHPGRGAYYHYPDRYAYYACDEGLTRVQSGVGGLRVYSCNSTPVATVAVVAAAAAMAGDGEAVQDLRPQVDIRSSPAVLYLLPPDGIVYATSYQPEAHYAHRAGERFFWVPGVRQPSLVSSRYILAAADGATPAGNATLISYRMPDGAVFLSSDPPFRDVYSLHDDGLFAWLPGVAQPTERQRETIDQVLALHQRQGARALEASVNKQRLEKPPAFFRPSP